jgi:hypothetical protein
MSDHHVLELAASKRVARVDPVANLQDSIGDLDASGPRELVELSQRVLGLSGASLVADVH